MPTLREGVRPQGLFGEWYRKPRYFESTRDLMSWMDGTVKYIVDSDGQVEAYDLAQDPRELEALALTEAQQAAALARAREWWEEHPLPQSGGHEVSEEELRLMQALGYAGSDSD